MGSTRIGLLAALVTVVAVVAALLGGTATAQAADCPWMQPGKSPEQRAHELIGAMSLDQKIHQVHQSNPPWFFYFGTAGHIDGTPELCIPTLVLSDAGSGVAGLQEGTTTFPSGVGQAATWNPALERKFGEAMGQEAYDKGVNVMLGPGMNIARIATNGRNFEYFGEDPFLAGTMVTQAVRGIQSNPVLAQIKHYAANNQENNRNAVSAEVDERTLREIYLPAFESAIKKGHAASAMCSYNKLNGTYACENPELLDGFLRRDWGFEGFVTSDWGATHSTVESAKAGLDMEMHATPSQYYGDALKAAVESGKVPMARLDGMLRHIFVPMFRFGLFDKPIKGEPGGYVAQAITEEHRALARKIAEEATVLLKNDRGALPLSTAGGQTVGVIGYGAGPVGAANTSGGGGSSKGSGVPRPVSPLEGIQQQAAAHGDKVLYADGSSQADADAVARASDVVVVFAADTEQEGSDRPDLGFRPGVCPFVCGNVPLDQDGMVKAAAGANPNTIVVIAAGAPVAMPWLGDVRAVVDQWYAGTENGNAIAAVLYGQANPSGKLPQTFPKSLDQMPTRTPEQYPGKDGKAHYTEGLKVGYRWFDSRGIEPLFPFGYGLSYTSFGYSGLKAKAQKRGRATVSFNVKNTGGRTGAEVAQVYVGFPKWTGEPPRQLKGFQKVELESGASKRVTVGLDKRAFSYWAGKDWRVGRGCYTIEVGGSSRSLPLKAAVPMGGGHCAKARKRR